MDNTQPDSICYECGMPLEDANEYHPAEFCALVRAGFDPWLLVFEVARQVPPERYATKED